jgi:hypothetical protein
MVSHDARLDRLIKGPEREIVRLVIQDKNMTWTEPGRLRLSITSFLFLNFLSHCTPHIRFANAKTDQELITFVKKFGPIWTESIAEEDTDRFLFRAAKQSLDTLHREQRIYAAALDLLEELAKGKDGKCAEHSSLPFRHC